MTYQADAELNAKNVEQKSAIRQKQTAPYMKSVRSASELSKIKDTYQSPCYGW